MLLDGLFFKYKRKKNNFVDEAFDENLWGLWRLGALLLRIKFHVFGVFLLLFLVIIEPMFFVKSQLTKFHGVR